MVSIHKLLSKKHYILMDYNSKAKLYNFNKQCYMFVCSEDDFDSNGWQEVDGFRFKEKLFILGFPTKGIWKKASLLKLIFLCTFCNAITPTDITIQVNNGNVRSYILSKYAKERILSYEQINKRDIYIPLYLQFLLNKRETV